MANDKQEVSARFCEECNKSVHADEVLFDKDGEAITHLGCGARPRATIEDAKQFIQKKAGIVPAKIWTFGEFERMAEYVVEFANHD